MHEAYNQWATRPPDERFWTLDEMYDACQEHYDRAAQATVRANELRLEAREDDLRLVGRTGVPANLSHFAFGQLCSRARAPASYLRGLPATLAAQNVNHGLKNLEPTAEANLLLHRHDDGLGLTLRAALSSRYERLWNWEFIERIQAVLGGTWRPPPGRPANDDPRARPATEEDCLKRRANNMLSVQPGNLIAPAGLYASDKDMFAFLLDEEHVITDGTPDGLIRGLMLWNSEVGDRKIGGRAFLFKSVCGNHIVVGAKGTIEWGSTHVGSTLHQKAWSSLERVAKKYSTSSVSQEARAIGMARGKELGTKKHEVVDAVFDYAKTKRVGAVTRDRLKAAYDLAEKHEPWYGTTPNTVWGMVQGYTEHATKTAHTDARVEQERAAGRIMEMAF